MIVDLLRVTLPGFLLGAVVMWLANQRAGRDVARGRWRKLAVFFLIVHAVLAVAAAGSASVVALLAVVLVAGGLELLRAWRRIVPPRPARVWPIYLLVGAVVLGNAWRLPPPAFVFLFLVTAGCDGFSQVFGQWLGRRPLAPRLSPGKTVGGLVGGLAAALVMAVLLRGLVGLGPSASAALGLFAGITGLGGDLAASWVKRRAGIKDYSSALPGQGGFLDRFDSLLGALAVTGSALVALG